jgi:hypothetical protein
MNASSRCRIVLPLAMLISAFAFSAQAQNQNPGNPPPGGPPPAKKGPPPGPAKAPLQVQKQVQGGVPGGRPPGPPGGPGFRGPDARFARGEIRHHDFDGHAYRGRLGWEQGRWRHEVHNGRDGWWWDVGGVWYFYPQQMDGPPAYVSEDFADDVVYADAPPPGAYPPPGPGPYPAAAAYPPPPPPPPPPDPAASAVGGAVVGGLLGGLLTGRASGAAAGAVIGGATGAIAGATAASRPGYWLANGECYYRYPSGQYVPADPRWCY